MVLLNLSPSTLLVAQQTNCQFFKTIEGSPKLQQKMMLEQTGGGLFSTFLPEGGYHGRYHGETLLGLSCKIRPPGIPHDDKAYNAFFVATPMVSMELFVYIDPGQLPSIGARCQRILLCEPIITSLTVFPGCCGALGDSEYSILWRDEAEDSVHEISNPTGLTIGDIYSAARQLKEHPDCVFRGVTFRGSVNVRSTDPIVIMWLSRCQPTTFYGDDTDYAGHDAEDYAEDNGEDDVEDDELVHGYDDAKEIGQSDALQGF